MIGNDLRRDVGGANTLGLISVWPDWAPRRAKVPRSPLEVPNYVARNPRYILDILAEIETGLRSAGDL